jgi:hypothetical protein
VILHPASRASRRRRVLIVNCYMDDTRASIGRRRKIPSAMGPVYLAGALSEDRCDVRLYSELNSGPLEDPRILAWPDMLVLTGLTTALDRMRHLTAYARTKNPKVIVVAGGHAVRALPRYCSAFFDYCCQGDVEELREVVEDAFGPGHASEQMQPRFDLAPWLGRLGFVETSRHCNFRCSFCVLTSEGRRYQLYDLDDVHRQIVALGRRDYLVLIDNNFFGNDRKRFSAKLDLLRELWQQGWFRGWGALVTSDFFYDEANLTRFRESGGGGLFSGLESFDVEWLQRNNKMQNARVEPVDMIRRTLRTGVGFSYGLLLDVTTRRLDELRRELDFIVGCPEIPLPAYLSVSIPMLKTPLFYDCLRRGILLPNTRIRDLDGTTLSVRPLDPIAEVATFLRDLRTFRGYRQRAIRHTMGFLRRYRPVLNPGSLAIALMNAALLCAPVGMSGPTRGRGRRLKRTHVSSTDVLDSVYTPAFPVDRRYAHYFEPTYLTDATGALTEHVAEDLAETSSPRGRMTDFR